MSRNTRFTDNKANYSGSEKSFDSTDSSCLNKDFKNTNVSDEKFKRKFVIAEGS